MNKRAFETWFKQVYEVFGDFLDAYEEANPHWRHITLGQLIYGAAHSLKTYIENPDEGEITWDHPRVELQYDVAMDWERLSPLFFTLAQEDMDSQSGGSLEKTAEKLIKGYCVYQTEHPSRSNGTPLTFKRNTPHVQPVLLGFQMLLGFQN